MEDNFYYFVGWKHRRTEKENKQKEEIEEATKKV